MTNRDDPGTRPSWTGTRIAVGVVSLAALLGTGAYVITDRLTPHRDTVTDVGALAPAPAPGHTSTTTASPAPASALGSAASISPEVAAEIKKAREKAAKDGVPLIRPKPAQSTRAVTGLMRTTKGTLNEGGIVRVVSARSDLTGQQELAWVAGGVTTYGGAECSQTFRFSSSPAPVKRPNLLLCWRTSAKKSVVAIVVDPKGKPSKAKAVDLLEKKWRSME